METVDAVQTGQNGQARQMTAPELRAHLAGAGIKIEHLNGRILTRKAGERAKRWAPTWNSNAREVEQLHHIARVYNVVMA